MKNLITIQAEYVETINAGVARWSQRKHGGHADRIRRGAYRKAGQALSRLGLTPEQVQAALKDANDMAVLQRIAGE
jgi:hypothetical protein